MTPEPPVLLPPTAEPPLERLQRGVQTVWRAGLLLGWALPVLTALGFDVLRLFRAGGLPPFLVTGVVLLVAALHIGVGPWLRYRYWRFAATEEALFAERGWFTHIRTTVPLSRIQHIDVVQNLFEREVELARLVVHTAGTSNTTVTVPGLPHARAEALRDRMRSFLSEDPL